MTNLVLDGFVIAFLLVQSLALAPSTFGAFQAKAYVPEQGFEQAAMHPVIDRIERGTIMQEDTANPGTKPLLDPQTSQGIPLKGGQSVWIEADNLQVDTDSLLPAFAAGGFHTCALTPAGGVKCWGYNAFGQLGDGSTVSRTLPRSVNTLSTGATAISAGNNHSCALLSGGTVKCWGRNDLNQLGHGTSVMETDPVEVIGLGLPVVEIDAGYDHTCALLSTGIVMCWGDNAYGQLGDGTTEKRTSPVEAAGVAGAISVSAGGHHTCALLNTGVVMCWGRNENGQLGLGSAISQPSPMPVFGLTGAVDLTAGYSHTCAVVAGGVVRCWGAGGDYQLGRDSTADSASPLLVEGLAGNTVRVEAGYWHTCALDQAGVLSCWGRNSSGQVGDGTTVSRPAPVEVIGVDAGTFEIAAGATHTCAITQNDGAMCWGNNASGQVGNGTVTSELAPASTAMFRVDSPVLTSLIPAFVLAGSGESAFTIQGTGFEFGDQAFVNGAARPTSYLDTGHLSVQVLLEDIAVAGKLPLTVKHMDALRGSDPILLEVYTFADVIPGSWYYHYVKDFFAQGITTGCASMPLRYCPDRAVTRAEMAVFILRSKNGLTVPTPSEIGMFSDVPAVGKDWMQPWIEEFYLEGITTGCASSPLGYCPERQVTRAEMAVFILRAIRGKDYVPPAANGIFSDVPAAGKEWMQPWIEEFYRAGITTGCKQAPTLQYCPEASVTRAEMATFLDRAFGFPRTP